jgi:pantetheine-phosphate adenylyltransferase
MSRTVTAVYSGTFDPITLGHEDVVYRASQMFDKVVVAVATAHHKKTMFTLEERLAMAQEVTQDLGNVTVLPFCTAKARVSLCEVCAPSLTTITKHKWPA